MQVFGCHVVTDHRKVIDANEAAQIDDREVCVVADGQAPTQVVKGGCGQDVHLGHVGDVEVPVDLLKSREVKFAHLIQRVDLDVPIDCLKARKVGRLHLIVVLDNTLQNLSAQLNQ